MDKSIWTRTAVLSAVKNLITVKRVSDGPRMGLADQAYMCLYLKVTCHLMFGVLHSPWIS